MFTRSTTTRAFTLIEIVIVVAIIGVIAGIAVPRFADASAGRRLGAAKKTLIADIEFTKLRARATGKTHVIKFYASENKYIVVEGTDIKREAVVLTRDFDDDPYLLEIRRTDLSGDATVVVTPYGDLSPGFKVGLLEDGTEISVVFDGVDDVGVSPTLNISLPEVLGLKVNITLPNLFK